MTDMFTMIDFYGRKRRCLELGHPLTKEDDKWYKDQKYRLTKRLKELKEVSQGNAPSPEVWNEMQELRKQLQSLAPLNLPNTNNDISNTRQSVRKSAAKFDSIGSSENIGLSLDEDFGAGMQSVCKPGADTTEDKEVALERQL